MPLMNMRVGVFHGSLRSVIKNYVHSFDDQAFQPPHAKEVQENKLFAEKLKFQ